MSKIKLIIFDLDGVLVDIKNIHYETLNQALVKVNPLYEISWDEHLDKYDGLKTNQKLEMLTLDRGLPMDKYKQIWDDKQSLTLDELRGIKENVLLLDTIRILSNDGYKIACCSNSIKKTVLTVLSKLNIIEYFDIILSNEDVQNGKPHPEIYWKCISTIGCLPEETLIVEDSPYGLLSAHRSNSNILRVLNTSEVSLPNITKRINEIENHA
jgi:HAD superfamily hydrolase (TIGR01509 family)